VCASSTGLFTSSHEVSGERKKSKARLPERSVTIVGVFAYAKRKPFSEQHIAPECLPKVEKKRAKRVEGRDEGTAIRHLLLLCLLITSILYNAIYFVSLSVLIAEDGGRDEVKN
jgi:hypothetical protein